jgi:hypothetical protein
MYLQNTPESRQGSRSASARAVGSIVIMDSGDAASVVVVERELPVGWRFRHGGIEWLITGRRPSGPALVAEPIRG